MDFVSVLGPITGFREFRGCTGLQVYTVYKLQKVGTWFLRMIRAGILFRIPFAVRG